MTFTIYLQFASNSINIKIELFYQFYTIFKFTVDKKVNENSDFLRFRTPKIFLNFFCQVIMKALKYHCYRAFSGTNQIIRRTYNECKLYENERSYCAYVHLKINDIFVDSARIFSKANQNWKGQSLE